MSKLPRGAVSLLFTDIEGSTLLLRSIGRERYVRSLEQHRVLLRNAFATGDGVEVEMQGDSFFFAFPYAREAVGAAIAAQRALSAHHWEDAPIAVRIGIHTGEPSITADLYAGLDVHRASRVMSAAHGGQILLSARTRDLVEDELPTGASLEDLGVFELKDIDRPESLTQVVAPGLRRDFPPPRATPAPPGHAAARTSWRRARLLVPIGIALAVLAALAAALSLARGGGTLTKDVVVAIEPSRNAVVGRTHVGQVPTSISTGAQGVWIVNAADATVSQLDEKGHLVRTVGTMGNPMDVLARPDTVWVGNRPNHV